MKKSILFDVVIFIVLLLATSSFPWLVEGTVLNNPMIWSFVVVIPIATFLGLRKKKNWKKVISGSLVFGLLFGVILEFIAHVTLAWQVPNTIFPFRILGASTIEGLIGYIPMTLLVLVFYEHFFDEDISHKISPRIWSAIIPAILAIVLITFIYLTNPSRLMFSHPYLKIGLAAIIPMIWQITRKPSLLLKYLKLSASLFFVFFIFEIVGVTFNYWIFPGNNYMGMVTYLGRTFPVEEIIFWMLLYPPTIVSYYEKFIDDEK
ncbi:MAG: hypothetical protein A3B91_01490 [Candidatus Yanofskybacteria bacterium RIFCSPHIGHO2_02_FULL_41_29]|uniref:Lycopene cyclase domain-containing protein n=1 Tax=Candidatus Yanofskybacteria bacterium RIFCSPHIGHO2_01_FULL_41_53 TaxID=1802663 RepID=A0A1F8EFR4_9BACT|nr:MAG: hypothetical protein A2650_00910 [Candidatus Yanofskybacteria bacterium RIFCSPHIGHO2_01_FULL_41_53]OGN11044.1 MAG: hypothetical protein A3B91_01490 [Candidatus Yanofskybacteria bacterium RIFCSPHIGHO2_02_FULL_41_29]OGN18477.1 MAG: hypothetical protein A3F48_02665 [Candidatus Yanofskybacteria bacterium RIFCSPHIGHO2_12_FULL_41_9]OGN21961.1 MAG: hypothetical protein A2916_02935 [Candidatus Yanofskybacteria bacterium RIFCSPLOWO2_01_FULL_41_67]OGN30236.1 MAG: hypothetical protein A3H54_02615 